MIPQLVGATRTLAKYLLEPFARPVRAARDLANAAPGLVLLLLTVLVVCAVLAIRGNRLAALALIPLSLAWLVFNTPFEGPTLIVLSWSHGLTVSDLIAVAGLGIAGWRLTEAVLAPLR
jgi:hypothetical protein